MATQLDLADAQFVGFRHCKSNSTDIVGLVQAMGLTKSEWNKWKENYPTTHLEENEINEIDNFFNPPEQTPQSG